MQEKLDLTNIPKHVAIILDGNGRWAKKRLMPRTYGHLHGTFNIEKIVRRASELKVKAVSIYCFSTENWLRPEKEVNYLMKLPTKYFRKYEDKILNSNVKIIFSGRRDRINNDLFRLLNYVEKNTCQNDGLILNICFDYGSRDEILEATKKIACLYKDNKITLDDINEELFNNNLYTKELGNVDLLIRTSGEQRLSNFLLWQCAYAEFYFTDVLWPDFNEDEFDKAIINYQGRNRRFGGLKEKK